MTFLLILILNLGTTEKGWLSAETSEELLQQAESLNQSGQKSLNLGDPLTALKDWQEATKIYRQVKYQEGITGSLINQSLAYQQVGFNLKACSTLLQSMALKTDWLCDPSLPQTPNDPKPALSIAIDGLPPLQINALGLQNLGDVLRAIGKLEEAELVLQKALKISQIIESPSNVYSIKLSLGNLQHSNFNQLRDRYLDIGDYSSQQTYLFSMQSAVDNSVQYFQQLEQLEVSKPVKLLAFLDHLALLIDADKFFAAQIEGNKRYLTNYYNQIHAQTHPLANKIQQAPDFQELPENQSVLVQLNYANSLDYLGERPLAIQYAISALQLAQKLNSSRLQSNCYGILAAFVDEKKSQGYLEAALELANSVQARDLAWRWQHQLARLYQKQGDFAQAELAYSGAIDNLSLVRSNLLSVTPDIQYSFRDQVEPVYHEYLHLLLSKERPDLSQVVKINDALQLAELENYLQCNRLDLVSFSQLKHLPDRPTAIHLLDLGDSVEVIVESPDGSFHRFTPDSHRVKDNVAFLLDNTQSLDFAYTELDKILPIAQTLYQELIQPIKPYLPESGTLVIIADSSFQNLPFGVLHDGQKYLLQQYSLSLGLNSQVRQPRALSHNQLRVLVAGLATQRPPSFSSPGVPRGLSPLPETLSEATVIKQSLRSAVLLNSNFTTNRFQQEISKGEYPIIHISTHGRFSSDPARTYILDWDQALNLKEVNTLLRRSLDLESLELLVLSACQTAVGDERAALGIAGVAVQAGARSTVATLWLVNTDSTAVLMGEFYKGLKAGLSKAEALRQAQLSLLGNPKYSHPYYWSPFILAGDWL